MASPFSIFRKYMKPMMVVLCGLAMLAFVVVDPLMQYFGSRSQGGQAGPDGSKVVVSWNDGELTEYELASLVDRRRLLNQFVRTIQQVGYEAAYRDGTSDLQPAVQPLFLRTEPGEGVEQDVVRTQIIAEEARRLGMTVSDEAVRDYLDKLGRNRVTFDQMEAIVSGMQGQRRIPAKYLLDAMREELLKQNYLASYWYSIFTPLPEQQWADWLKVNDRVIVEAAAIKAIDYMDKVPDPSEEELLAFYDEYKDDEPMPDMRYNLPAPTPGFQVPRKVRIEYLEANFNDELQSVMATITDEEVTKYYEENKRLFERADSAFTAEPATDVPPAKETDSKEAEKELFDVPSGEQPEAEPETPPMEKAETPAETTETPAVTPETPAETPEPPKDEQSSGVEVSSPFRLVALQEPAETNEPAADEKEVEEKPAADATPEETKPAEAAPTETAPADATAPAATPPATAPSDLGEPAGETPAATTPAEKPVQYQSLDEVREEIRRTLASGKVHEQMRKKMNELREQLQPAYLDYFDAVLDARVQKKPAPEPPAALKNLQALAEPNGLTYHDTGELSMTEMVKLPIGKSLDANESAAQDFNLTGLALLRLKDYQPIITRDSADGNRYLAMKTADVAAYIPKLEDIRDEVVQAWKRQEASKLALKDAEQIAKDLDKSGETLGDKFAGNPKVEVVVTDPFSQLTVGETPPTNQLVNFRFSDPVPLVSAGPDLLKKVFELGEGQVGAVFNHDHSIAYLVRIQKHLETPEELRQNYLAEMATGWFGAPTFQNAHRQDAINTVVGGLVDEADLEWKRPPDRRDQSEGG